MQYVDTVKANGVMLNLLAINGISPSYICINFGGKSYGDYKYKGSFKGKYVLSECDEAHILLGFSIKPSKDVITKLRSILRTAYGRHCIPNPYGSTNDFTMYGHFKCEGVPDNLQGTSLVLK